MKFRNGSSTPLRIWLGSQKKWVVIKQKKRFYAQATVPELNNIIKLQHLHLQSTTDPIARKQLLQTIRKVRLAVKRKTK